MAPPESTAIPAAWRARGSSKDCSGVPLDSNLWTKPAPGSTKKMLPSESAANATGSSSLPGPSPLSPQAPRNSNGGGGCGFGAGFARFPQETRKNNATSEARGSLHRDGSEFVFAIRQTYVQRSCELFD